MGADSASSLPDAVRGGLWSFVDSINAAKERMRLQCPGPYENLHRESKTTLPTMHMVDGAKFDISSVLSPAFQVTHSFTWGAAQYPPAYNFSVGLQQRKYLLYGSVDHDGGLQARGNYMWTLPPLTDALEAVIPPLEKPDGAMDRPEDIGAPQQPPTPQVPPPVNKLSNATKFQAQLTSQPGQSMVQLEHEYVGETFSLSVKAINPNPIDAPPANWGPTVSSSIPPSTLTGIFTVSALQSVSESLAVGGELVSQRPSPDINESSYSLALRWAPPASVLPPPSSLFAGMPSPYMPVNPKDPTQVFATTYSVSTGILHASYWRRLNQRLEVATECQMLLTGAKPERGLAEGRREGVMSAGFKLETLFATIRGGIDSHGKVSTIVEERMAPGLSFQLCGEMDYSKGHGGSGKVDELGMPTPKRRKTNLRTGVEGGRQTGIPLVGSVDVAESENYVEYRIFPPEDAAASNYADGPTSQVELSFLILSHITRWTDDYIWHKDAFNLRVVEDDQETNQPYLFGRVRFADCIDDEWFVVFLLREISKAFKDTVISVMDNDGQFLLIEAAHFIPSWLDPSNADNRIFIADGRLRLIPLPTSPADIAILPSGYLIPLYRALRVIRLHPAMTLAPKDVEGAAFKRFADYPEKLTSATVHRSKCYVPRDVARILAVDPTLVAPAVEAFYNRDPLQLKVCQKMARFPPSTSVKTTVKFTRTLYAQLVGQRFHAPTPFMATRDAMVGSDKAEMDAFELGMKLACGFEMLAKDGRATEITSGVETPETHSWDTDWRWISFNERLARLGYYKNEMKGSKLYKTLEATAKIQFLKASEKDVGDGEVLSAVESNPVHRLFAALRVAPDADEDIVSDAQTDSDAWMTLDASGLEESLRRSGYDDAEGVKLEDLEDIEGEGERKPVEGEDEQMGSDVDQNEVENLNRVARDFEAFVAKESDVDGVLFPDEMSEGGSADEDLAEQLNDEVIENAVEDQTKPVSLDAEQFLAAMTKLLQMDESVLAPLSSTGDKELLKGKHTTPKAAPNEFNPHDFLRPPTKFTVMEDEPNDEMMSVLRANRGGLQAAESDSEDEAEMEKEWERRLRPRASSVEQGTTHDALDQGGAQGGGMAADADDDEMDMSLEEYMCAMDQELAGTKVGASFKGGRQGSARGAGAENEAAADLAEEDQAPVDVDYNLVRNLLQSFSAQEGMPGPASNILGRLGLSLPRDAENV
ncbi:hypothetical protein HK101_009255 [Irineochytrium annulatum]|nr:hypothetical protein HK101_009255 [Irineochytrium annulatum]